MRGGRTHPVVSSRLTGRKKGHATRNLTLYPNRLENSRVDVLKQLLAENPGNTFARYGLAMEHLKSGDLESAAGEFQAVLEHDANYAAAYYHGGQTLEKLGKLDEARDLYKRGVTIARDPHARAELQAALDILGD